MWIFHALPLGSLPTVCFSHMIVLPHCGIYSWESFDFVSVTPHWSSFESYPCYPCRGCSVYSDPASLFVFSSGLRGGGTKGKSMGLCWSGAKAVIKRYRKQSHTLHQEWKSFACTALIFFTPSVTHLSVRMCAFVPLYSLTFVSPPPYSPHPSFPAKIISHMHILYSRAYTHMQTHNIPLKLWMPVIIPCEVWAIWAWGGKLLPLASQKRCALSTIS